MPASDAIVAALLDRHGTSFAEDEAKYLRKQRTAKLLGRSARTVVDDDGGDLPRLWAAAGGDADTARDLLLVRCDLAGDEDEIRAAAR